MFAQEIFTLAKQWYLNEYSSVPLTEEPWKEYPQGMGYQDLRTELQTQSASNIMTEESESLQVTYSN